MYKIVYRIKTLSPVLISSNTGDRNMTATLDYISGSVVLGTLAGRFIRLKDLRDKAHEDETFSQWFLNGKIIFSNAYPCKEDENGNKVSFPVPLSIQAEKNNDMNAVDLLHDDPESEEPRKTVPGFCYFEGNNIKKLTPAKRLNFHHSRPDRIMGHSKDGEIFNYESLDPHQIFEGVILGECDSLQDFQKLFGQVGIFIQLGRSRSAQYGQAVLEFLSQVPEEFRVEEDITNEFVLTFLSPAIIYNQYGFPSTSLDDLKRYLSVALSIGTEKITINRSFKRPVMIENFNSAWRLKRPSEIAFQAGSCFAIQVKEFADPIKTNLINLQKGGLGERRGEGFGRIIINMQKEGTYSINEADKKTDISQPSGDVPELVKETFKKILKENIKKVVEREALSKLKDIKHQPLTNSLLGRLESMIKTANNKNEFLERLNRIRSTAREKLESAKVDMTTFLEFIQAGNPDVAEFVRQQSNLDKIAGLINYDLSYDLSADQPFLNELYSLYWLTLLRMIRKSKKKERGTINE